MRTTVFSFLCFAMMAVLPTCGAEVSFQKVILDKEFQAEGCAIADINRDGKPDIVAGDSWYEAPDWKKHRFRTVGKVRSYRDLRYDYPEDVNGDGWTDVLSVRFDRAVVWFENPRGKGARWTEHPVGEFDLCEGVLYGDLDGDGKGDFVGPFHPPAISWYERTREPEAPWTRREIGPRGGDRHGIGIGDVNRDGRNDLLTREGWYEAPRDPRNEEWTFHELSLGDSFVIYAYDVDGDGDNDLISSSPHNYGVWWWEQTTAVTEIRNGNVVQRLVETMWLRHTIDKSFSQAHALALVDLDGDGDKDLVSGKRYYAHDGRDPGADEPAVLLWFQLQREGGEVLWVRHAIDNDSGVGYQLAVGDITGDGNPEILTTNKKGVFLFKNESRQRWTKLFETEKELDAWIGDRKLWSVEKGVLTGRSPGIPRNTFLVSRDRFSDFILKLSVRLQPDSGNSGVQFRSEALEGGNVKGYQADIGEGWWGSLYDEHGRGLLVDGYKGKGEKAVRKREWNDYVVRAIGDHIQVEINGTITTNIRDAGPREGILAFQIHSGGAFVVEFKDVFLREIVGGEQK